MVIAATISSRVAVEAGKTAASSFIISWHLIFRQPEHESLLYRAGSAARYTKIKQQSGPVIDAWAA
jgi:hypothetical protein